MKSSLRRVVRHAQEVRCASCGMLLAKRDEAGLSIHRGDLQATFDGDFHASLVCYRCKSLVVVRLSPTAKKREGPGSS